MVVMQRIDQFVADLIKAESVEEDTAQNLVDEATEAVRQLDGVALQSTVVDESDSELAESEEFRNDTYSYSTVELGMMGTEMEYEIIELKDTDEVFVGMEDNSLGLGSENDTYLYGTTEEIEESFGFKPSNDVSEKETLLRFINGSDVSTADNLVFFENELNAEWLDTAFGTQVDSVYGVVVYDREQDQVQERFMTVRPTNDSAEHHFDEYQYDTSVSFIPPSPQSEDVIHIEDVGQLEAAKALLDGDGGMMGGLGGALGGSDGNPLLDQAMSMAEEVIDEDELDDDSNGGLF